MVENQVLESWKEIADYLKRSEKTCRRLEKELGLPVHRLEDTPKARVFAYKEEIDRWVEKTQHSEKEIFFGKLSMKKFLILVSIIAILAIITVGLWKILPHKKEIIPFSQRISVAVISFENQTGDDSYDYLNQVIPNLLTTNLEQSGYFYVTSWERLYDLLKQIGKEDVEVIDKDLGFELCQMDDVDAIVIGSFAKAGDMLVTDVKVLDVDTKRILMSASSRGKGEESILKSQIDELSREISHGLGLSKGKTEEASLHIADVTTDSLDAYVYYVIGKEYLGNNKFRDAVKFLKKAVELDPSFAMAYLKLMASFRMLGKTELGNEALEKAKNFSARATEKERLYIEGVYARIMEKDLEKSFRIFTKMAKYYPKEKSSYYGLALFYKRKNLYAQAIEEFKKVLELDPYDSSAIYAMATTYSSLKNYEKAIEYIDKHLSLSPGNAPSLSLKADAYFELGKFDESVAIFKESFKADPERYGWISAQMISYVYALNEDYTEARRWIDQGIDVSPPELVGWNLFVKSFYQFWVGSLDQCKHDLKLLIEHADKIRNEQWKANASWMMGWISLEKDEFELCRKHFKTWFDIYMRVVLPDMKDSAARKKHWAAWHSFYLGLVDLKQGKIASAKSRLDKINSLLPDVLPQFKNWISFYSDFLQAEILLAEGAEDKAISVCENFSLLGEPAEYGTLVLHNVPFLKDVLARAYLQKGEIDKAIAEYERLIAFDPKREERYLIHPKLYYRAAVLYEQKDMKDKAIEYYEKFILLWKDADTDLPEVEDAKKRLTGLKGQAYL